MRYSLLWVITACGFLFASTKVPELNFKFNWSRYVLEISKQTQGNQSNRTASKWQLRNAVKLDATAQAGAILEKFYIDSEHTVRELIEQNESFSEQYSLFLESIKPETIQFSGNSVLTTLKIPLRGDKGFVSILPLPWDTEKYYSLQKPESTLNYYETPKAEGEYINKGATMTFTGLIIDVRGMNFQPSFAPRLYNQQGRLIYGPEFIPAKTGVKRFAAGFTRDIKETEVKKRAGNRPLLTAALELKGDYATDAVLSNEDVQKLFVSKESLQNLRKCRVVFWY